MKLRSGKTLKYGLPWKIVEKLKHALADLKTLLANNLYFAIELVQVIAFALKDLKYLEWTR